MPTTPNSLKSSRNKLCGYSSNLKSFGSILFATGTKLPSPTPKGFFKKTSIANLHLSILPILDVASKISIENNTASLGPTD